MNGYRLGDSLPQEKLQLLKRLREEWERTHPAPRSEGDWEEHVRDLTRRAEAWLDEGYGACHFREPRWSNDLRDRLHHFDGERYHLAAWVIMPNHCHALIRPFDGYELEELLGAIHKILTTP